MADPGAQAIMLLRFQRGDLGADLVHPLQKVAAKPVIYILPRHRRDQPGCTLEKMRVRELHAAVLSGRHRMTSEKALGDGFAEDSTRTRDDFRLVLPTSVRRVLGERDRPSESIRSMIAPTGVARTT